MKPTTNWSMVERKPRRESYRPDVPPRPRDTKYSQSVAYCIFIHTFLCIHFPPSRLERSRRACLSRRSQTDTSQGEIEHRTNAPKTHVGYTNLSLWWHCAYIHTQTYRYSSDAYTHCTSIVQSHHEDATNPAVRCVAVRGLGNLGARATPPRGVWYRPRERGTWVI